MKWICECCGIEFDRMANQTFCLNCIVTHRESLQKINYLKHKVKLMDEEITALRYQIYKLKKPGEINE